MTPTLPRRGHLPVGRLRLAYQVHGQGTPLLLIEGLGYASWMWFKQVPALAERHRVVLFDNRGVGDSDKPNEPYSIAGMADEAAGVLDGLGIASAHVLGVSMGGMIAQELALRHPERVRGLILACTTLGGAAATPMSAETMSAMLSLRRDLPLDRALLLAMEAAVSREYFRASQDELRRIVGWRIANPTPAHAWMRQWEAGAAHDTATRAHLIAAPTLVLTGDQDRIVPPENASAIARRVPHARLETFPGGGHLFFIEQAAAFNAAVLRFVAELDTAHPSAGATVRPTTRTDGGSE